MLIFYVLVQKFRWEEIASAVLHVCLEEDKNYLTECVIIIISCVFLY
jgi:hypothetical protein